MAVIGRLDGQVEEVIINPVGRRRAGGDADAPLTPTAPHDPPEATESGDGEQRGGERRGADELPVWLL